MAIEKNIVINVKQKGLDETLKKVNKLDASLDDLGETNKELSKTMGGTKQSILDNGGAMGLLNDATGGLAMTVKDAVEASALFAKESKIGMGVQKAYTAVMGTSTGALKVFKLALIGTGIGAIIIGIGLLIANFDNVKTAVMNLIPGLESVGDFFGKIINSVTDFIGVTSDATRATDKLIEAAKKSNALNEKFLEEEGYFYDEFTKKKIAAKKEYNDAIQKEGANEIKLTRQLNAQIASIDQERIDAAKKRKEDAAKKESEEPKREKVVGVEANAIGYDMGVEQLDQQRLIGDQQIFQNRAILAQIKVDNQRWREENLAEELAIEELRKASKLQALNDLQTIFGQETAMGKAVLLAKQGIALQELIINIKSTIDAARTAATKSTLKAAEAGVDIAAGAGKTLASAPFPANIPLIIGYASSAFGIFTSIKSALTKVKGASASSIGGSDGGSTPIAPAAPSFNLVQGTGSNQIAQGLGQGQRPIQAYVVSNNVTTAQALDRNIIAGASL